MVAVSDDARRITHMAASVLLDYPDEDAPARLATVRAAVAGLPPHLSAHFTRFLDEADRMGQRSLAEHYVRIFDQKRRATLYLSYYDAGDTRKRGAAILAFQDALAATGWSLARKETPDFLPVVLELTARAEDPIADVVLAAHRDGLEVIRAALTALDSPYRWVLEAVCLTLPAIDDATRERVRALVTQGPPAELVGITAIPFPTFGAAEEARA